MPFLIYGGVLMINDDNWLGWVVVAFFSFAVLGAIANLLIPGAASLVLNPDGFEVKSMFRCSRYRWWDVGPFEIKSMYFRRYVCWQLTPDKNQPLARRIAGKVEETLSGMQAKLPDRYGMTPDALAALMNEWRSRALVGKRLEI